MTREIEITIADKPVACGTYDDCARMLGYSRSTLVHYATTANPKTPLVVRPLPPLYDIEGFEEPFGEEEACRILGIEKKALQTRASNPENKRVMRHRREAWALPPEEFERLHRERNAGRNEA